MLIDPIHFSKSFTILNNLFRVDVSEFPLWNLSYSLYGEDLILRGLLKQKLKDGLIGYYVDLGCNDPRQGSNSYLFYRYGWRGVCVDANPKYAERFSEIRPRDLFVHALVAEPGRWYWAQNKNNLGMSRVESSPEKFGEEYGTPVAMDAVPLAEILDRHLPAGAKIDFMTVDLEDSEIGAFRSNDWNRFRPNIILVETHGIGFENAGESPVLNFLREQGYRIAALAIGNAILVAE